MMRKSIFRYYFLIGVLSIIFSLSGARFSLAQVLAPGSSTVKSIPGEETAPMIIVEIETHSATEVLSATVPSLPKLTPKAIQKVTEKSFTFALLQAKVSGTSITCDLLITNKVQDRELSLFTDDPTFGISKIVDVAGNEYLAKHVQLGDKAGKIVKYMVTHGTSARAKLVFPGVSAPIGKISLLDMDCNAVFMFKVQFRDIPLAR